MATSAKIQKKTEKFQQTKNVNESNSDSDNGDDNDGEFSTKWDIDGHRTEYESEEHWELRRRFMEVHKDKFPEERLVCLARVFTNIEFMGCRYPTETMRLVAELSKDLAKDFREERESRLKRTFVTASDAAEQRAKGQRKAKQRQQNNSNSKQQSNQRSNARDLFAGLPYGNFVLYFIGGRSCLSVSAQRCGMEYKEREVLGEDGQKKIVIYLGDKVVASAWNENVKTSKTVAFNQALELLQKECYTIKPNRLAEKIQITKTGNNEVVCNILKEELEEKKLDQNNKGYKLMKLMGWNGGGLGSSEQGREDPVSYLFKNNRAGLGNEGNALTRKYFSQMLENYKTSKDIRELRFEPSFTKEERATLHEIAGKFDLKSNSYGKAEARHLIICKKNKSSEEILREVLLLKNPSYIKQYLVQVPESKTAQYPEHTSHLTLHDEI